MKVFHKILFILLSICVCLLGSCSSFNKFSETPLLITFVETGDLNGAIFAAENFTKDENSNSLSKIYSFVEEQRANNNELILLDNGNAFNSNFASYYYNFVNTETQNLWASVSSYLKYNAMCLGEKDFLQGSYYYNSLQEASPVVAANVVKIDTKEPCFSPYTIIDIQGVKIAVIGIIDNTITDKLSASFYDGMEFLDPVSSVEKYIKHVKDIEKADIVVGLFNSIDTDLSSNIVTNVSGLDIVFDNKAGSKKVLSSDGKQVPVFGASKDANDFVSVILAMRWNKKEKTWITEVSGSLVPVSSLAENPSYNEQFATEKIELSQCLTEQVGKISKAIYSKDAMYGDSAFMDLIHKAQFEVSQYEQNIDIDVTVAAPFDKNVVFPESSDGTIKVCDILHMFKTNNNIYVLNLTGEQLKKYMEYTYGNQFSTMRGSMFQLIKFRKDSTGRLVFDHEQNSYETETPITNFDSFSGIEYTVDVSKSEGGRVSVLKMADGSAFDEQKTYKVAFNYSRLIENPDNLLNGLNISKEELLSRYVENCYVSKNDLSFYILKVLEKQNGQIVLDCDNSWKVIPLNYASSGRENSDAYLYPDFFN